MNRRDVRRCGLVLAVAGIVGLGWSSSAPGASTLAMARSAHQSASAGSFTDITNQYLPLKPGTVFEYRGRKDGRPERNVVTVTHRTKTIQGVRCVVVHDEVWVNGQVAENTIDWYAQDRQGNVWYFGEASKDFKNAKLLTTEGSWQAGVHGARAGIVMQSHPRAGVSYRQEYQAGVAEDQAAVVSIGSPVTVPYGSFRHALKTREWTRLEPKVLEHKYYAAGVGNVYTTMVKGGTDFDKLVTVRHTG